MTDPKEIARGIAVNYCHWPNCNAEHTDCSLSSTIAAALLEHVKAEYHNGFVAGRINGDAEGYERGKKEIRDACSQHQHEQYADGYRRGVEDCKNVVKAAKIDRNCVTTSAITKVILEAIECNQEDGK